MDNFQTSLGQIKAANDEDKYDVLYVNTPWHKLSRDQLTRLAIGDLSKKSSLLYIWADTFTMADTIGLIRDAGFEFESVYQVCDIASYPSSAEKGKAGEGAGQAEDAVDQNRVARRAKKSKTSRCPPLNPPRYWTADKRGSSRGTTEFLLLARRGDPGEVDSLGNDKAGTLPFQVVRHPELGRKSRSVARKNAVLDPEWCVDRPADFMESVRAHLNPEARMLELFGSSMRDEVDALGPNIPGGFAPRFSSTTGITGSLNRLMKSMRKVTLQAIATALTRMGQAEDRAVRIEEFKKIEEHWGAVVKALADMKPDHVSYDWSSEDSELPVEWLRLAVLSYASKNIAAFGQRRKKRKRSSPTGKPAGLHGIAEPREVSKELTDFLGLEEGTKVARTTAVKLVNDYVKEHSLKNPDKKIEILPDEKLARLLRHDPESGDVVTFFRLSSMVTHHFPKAAAKGAAGDKENAAVVVEAPGVPEVSEVIEVTENGPGVKKQKAAGAGVVEAKP